MATHHRTKLSFLKLLEDVFNKADFTVLIIMLLLVLLIWVTIGLWLFFLHHFNPDYYGTLGDTLGILNSLISTLAFAGIIYSVFQQNKVLKRQEVEIEENRLEIRIDRFEAKFFQMLAAQRAIVNEIDLKRKLKNNKENLRVVTTKGRECFRVIYNQRFKLELRRYYVDQYESPPEKYHNLYDLFSLNEIVFVYENQLFPKYQDDLGHYFRHLYRIVRLIDRSEFVQDSAEYIGILRAQLSMYELLLLYYNGLSKYGKEFRPLIEKYSILKSMNDGYLINGTKDIHDPISYELTAFGSKNEKFSQRSL